MTKIILFTKNDCPKCETLKKRLKQENLFDIIDEQHNVSTVDGMSFASFYEVLKENFPSLIHDDVKIFGSPIEIIRYLKTVEVGTDNDKNK